MWALLISQIKSHGNISCVEISAYPVGPLPKACSSGLGHSDTVTETLFVLRMWVVTYVLLKALHLDPSFGCYCLHWLQLFLWGLRVMLYWDSDIPSPGPSSTLWDTFLIVASPVVFLIPLPSLCMFLWHAPGLGWREEIMCISHGWPSASKSHLWDRHSHQLPDTWGSCDGASSLDISVMFLLVYLTPGYLPPPPPQVLAPLSQCAWVSCSLFDPSDSKWCAGARLLGSVSLNGYIYNFMVILTAVNDSGRKKPTRRVAPAGWVGLQGRGVGYGWCESSLESTLTQHPHQSPRPPGNKIS